MASLGLRWPHQQSGAMASTGPHGEKSGRWGRIGEDTSGLLPDQGPCQLTWSLRSALPEQQPLCWCVVGGTLGVLAPPLWSPPRVLRGQECAGGPAGSLTLPQHGRQPGSAPSDTQETEAQRGWVTRRAHTADRGLEVAPESYPPEACCSLIRSSLNCPSLNPGGWGSPWCPDVWLQCRSQRVRGDSLLGRSPTTGPGSEPSRTFPDPGGALQAPGDPACFPDSGSSSH